MKGNFGTNWSRLKRWKLWPQFLRLVPSSTMPEIGNVALLTLGCLALFIGIYGPGGLDNPLTPRVILVICGTLYAVWGFLLLMK